MDRHKGILLPGESSNRQTNNAPAVSSEVVPGQNSNSQTSAPPPGSETVPVPSATIQTSTPAPNSEVLPGRNPIGQINAPVSISKADPVQSSRAQINAAAPNLEVVPEHNSVIQNNATAPDSEVVPGQSSQSQIDASASNSEGVPGQSSNSQINVLIPISEVAPGQSLNIKIDAPGSNSDDAPGHPSNMQISAPTTNSAAAPVQSSDNQTAGPSAVQTEEDTSEPTNTHPENDDSDFSSDESTTSEEPEEVQEWRRQLAYYKDIYDKYYRQKVEEKSEGTRNQKTDQQASDMSSRSKGTGKQKADDTTSEMSTKTYGRRKRKSDKELSNMSPQERLEYHHTVLKRYCEEAMEKANMLGYVYGIVLEDDTVLTGCSESLRKWWEETINFEQAGPAAANQYILENQVKLATVNNNEPPQRTYNLLMKLCDGTLGSVLSTLVWKCKPPQRKFPFKQKCPPPWWPTGHESWWSETGEKRPEPGQLQYKKPHDIKKKWKAVIVLSVIKHLAPQFDLIVKTVKASKNLQDRLNVKEMEAWNFALKEEMKIYCQAHPNVSLSDLLKAFQSRNVLVPGPRRSSKLKKAAENRPGENRINPRPRMGKSLWSNQDTNLRFTCKNQGCLHHEIEFAFRNIAARDKHYQTCIYQIEKNQFAAAGDTLLMVPPFNSTSLNSEVVFQPIGSTSQEAVTPLSNIPQLTFPQCDSTLQVNVQKFGSTAEKDVPIFSSTTQGTVLPPGSTTQVIAPPMHLPEQMVQPPSQSLLTPVESSLLETLGQNMDTYSPQQDWEPSDVGVSSYLSAPTSSFDMDQWYPGFDFGGFYNGPGSSSAGGRDNDGSGSFMQLLDDVQQTAMMMPPQQQLDSADPSIYQHLLENFNFEGGNAMQMSNNIQSDAMPMPLQQQLYEADPLMQQIILESLYGAGGGSSSGTLQQTGFEPFENTKMQPFLSDKALETGRSDIRTNVQLPEGTDQFGQINPIGDSLALTQPFPGVPSISIPQASDIEQRELQDVQIPVQQSELQGAQTITPSEEFNQFGSGNNEYWPDWSFF